MSSIQNTSDLYSVVELGIQNPPSTQRINQRVLDQANIDIDAVRTPSPGLCNTYVGVQGLQRLRNDQKLTSQEQAGCGWLYKPSNGLIPEINRAAAGTKNGPNVPVAGATWYFGRGAQGLDAAAQRIFSQGCQTAQKCSQMRMLGEFQSVCKYCTATKSVIPVDASCVGPTIAGNASGTCGREGFRNMSGTGAGVLGMGSHVREAFATLDDLDQCTPPLSRDCLVQAARMSGCTDNGVLITALQSGTRGQALDKIPSFSMYQSVANPSLTPAIFADGSTSLENALGDFGRLMRDTQSPNQRLAKAAKGLCLGSDANEGFRSVFVEPFQASDFCAEIQPTTQMTSANLKCAQDRFLAASGSSKGTAYPTKPSGTFGAFDQSLSEIVRRVRRPANKDEQVDGLLKLRGDNSSVPPERLIRDDTTRGSETLWIMYPNMQSHKQPPIVIKADTMLSVIEKERWGTSPYPLITDKTKLSNYGVPQDQISFISVFEVRPDDDMNLKLQVDTDDGFIVGFNELPHSTNAWGSWRYQGATRYTSKDYRLTGAQAQTTNTMIVKWFQGGGGAVFDLQLNGARPDGKVRNMIYLTQEPRAPWLQMELCQRDNDGTGQRWGLFDTRFAGSTALSYEGQHIYSMGAVSKDVGFLTQEPVVPGMRGVARFFKGSTWHTNSFFNFTAFRTITLLVKPEGGLAKDSVASIFQFMNFTNTFGTGLHLVTDYQGTHFFQHWFGSKSTRLPTPVTLGQWNLVVLQFQGNSQQLNNVYCSAAPLNALRTTAGIRSFLTELRGKQGDGGSPVYGSAVQNPQFAGWLVLGGSGGQGFTDYKDVKGQNTWKDESFVGDIGWLHGFNTFMDTEEQLTKEVNQTWQSRWPIA